MRRITWVRHGQSEWNAVGRWQGQTDVHLSDFGRRQARALGERLQAKGGGDFDLIFTSDLQRAVETAQLAVPGREIVWDPRLREIGFGVFEGKARTEFSPEENEEMRQWWESPYDVTIRGGGESMTDVRNRVDLWMEELPERCSVLVFSHGGVIRDRLWRETGAPVAGVWSFSIENTSLTTIEHNARRTIIAGVNDHAHLEGLK